MIEAAGGWMVSKRMNGHSKCAEEECEGECHLGLTRLRSSGLSFQVHLQHKWSLPCHSNWLNQPRPHTLYFHTQYHDAACLRLPHQSIIQQVLSTNYSPHTHCTSRHNATTAPSSLEPQQKNTTYEPQKELNKERKGTDNIVDPKSKKTKQLTSWATSKKVFLLTRGILSISKKQELTEKQTPPRFPYYTHVWCTLETCKLLRLTTTWDRLKYFLPSFASWSPSSTHAHRQTNQHGILHLAFP